MKTKITLLLAMIVLTSGWANQLFAQSIPEDKKAVLLFDIRIDKLKESKLGTKAIAQNPMPTEAFNSMTRVFGQMSAPPAGIFEKPSPPKQFPAEVFVRMSFATADAGQQAFEAIKAEMDGEDFENNGKTYTRLNSDKNICYHMVNDKTFELGSEFYVFQKTPRRFFGTDNLEKTWTKRNDDAVRLAVDLGGTADIVELIQKNAKAAAGEMGPMGAVLSEFTQRLSNINALRLSIDLGAKDLLTIGATGNDAAQAEDFREALDSILGLGKFAGPGAIAGLKAMDPELHGVASELLKSLKATASGDEVSFVLPKPAGFDKAVMGAVENILPMMMGRSQETGGSGTRETAGSKAKEMAGARGQVVPKESVPTAEAIEANKLSQFMKPSAGPVPSGTVERVRFEQQPYNAEQLAADLRKIVPNYVWFHSKKDRGKKPYIQLTLDPFRFPHADLVSGHRVAGSLTQYCFERKSTFDTNGVDITSDDHSATFRLEKKFGSLINFPYAEGTTPARGTGRFAFQIPETRTLVTIPPGTANGASFPAGDNQLTVEFLNNDVVALRVTGTANFGTLQALDQEGRALRLIEQLHGGPGQPNLEARFEGSIHELQVVLLSQQHRDVTFEADLPLVPGDLAGRERYLSPNLMPKTYQPCKAADFENLVVKYIPKSKTVYTSKLVLPFGITNPDLKIDFDALGFGGNGPVSVSNAHSETEEMLRLGSPESCGVMFGTAKVTGSTGGYYIEVKKTGDGEKVAFEVNGETGEVLFSNNKVTLVSAPFGTRASIVLRYNADGIPLVYRQKTRDCIGIPTSARIYVITGREYRELPFEFDLGGKYDKTAYAAYRKKLVDKKNRDEIQSSADPVPTSGIGKRLDINQAYDAKSLAEQLTKEIKNQIWFTFLTNGYKAADFRMSDFQSSSPLSSSIYAEFEPLSAVNTNGVSILAPANPTQNQSQRLFELGRSQSFVFPFLSDKGEPKSGTGRFTLKMPTRSARLVIPAETKPGTSFLLGFGELTLLKLENDVAEFSLQGAHAGIIQALNKDDQVLQLNPLQTDPRSVIWNSGSVDKLRFKGAIDELEILLLSKASDDVPFDFDVDFKVMEIDEAVAAGRERYLSYQPALLQNATADQLESLTVNFDPANPEKNIADSFLNIPFPKSVVRHYASYTLYGFGKDGPVEIRPFEAVAGDRRRLDREAVEKSGILFGVATITGPSNYKNIVLEKTADGEAVPFTLAAPEDGRAASGELIFDKNEVKISKRPETGSASVLFIENASGQALRREGFKAWGIPTKATLATSTGQIAHTIPFEFELGGDYDKADLKEYRKLLTLVSAARDIIKKGSHVDHREAVAAMYFAHGKDGKPRKEIPEEVAKADPIGAEIFGYEAKPYLGYYIVAAYGESEKRRSKKSLKWDGGEVDVKRGSITKLNLVPADPTKPTFHLSRNSIHQKVLGELPDKKFIAEPKVHEAAEGWKQAIGF